MLQAISKKMFVGRHFVRRLFLTLTMVVGGSFIPIVGLGQVQAAGCRVISNPAQIGIYQSGEDGHVGYTNKYVVPSTSACQDINVQNIYYRGTRSGESRSCGTFWVRFYPSSGGSYTNAKHTVCSSGSNGPVVPIATGVLNGTTYRVEYWTNGDAGTIPPVPAYYYKLVD
jgi:hypothetical protein